MSARTTSRVRDIERARGPFRRLWKMLGPGFVTGASDDDPSGIGTYAVAGASLGTAMLWTQVFSLPLMSAVQNICARIAMVSGTGLAANIRERYSAKLMYPVLVALLLANTINLGADLGAIADAIGVVIGVKVMWLVVPIGVGFVVLQVLGGYRLIAGILKLLALALLAYVVDVVLVRPDVGATLRDNLVPRLAFDTAHVQMLVALLGTTISPYLFFWQTNEETEAEKAEGKRRRAQRRGATKKEIRYGTIDVNVGMAFSNAAAYFIVLATATTLFAAGKHDIRSAADAAEALRPLAGDLSGIVFAIGMIATGLLAIPVLAGSAAFAAAETFGWRAGLDRSPREGARFYAVLALATLIGMALNLIGVDPIDALVASAVLNGIVAPPLLVVIMLIARDDKVMGAQKVGPVLYTLGWATAVVMFLAVAGLAWTMLAS